MFTEFLNWAFAVTSDGCKNECVFEFKSELVSALSSKTISWAEFRGLMNIVNNGIYLTM